VDKEQIYSSNKINNDSIQIQNNTNSVDLIGHSFNSSDNYQLTITQNNLSNYYEPTKVQMLSKKTKSLNSKKRYHSELNKESIIQTEKIQQNECNKKKSGSETDFKIYNKNIMKDEPISPINNENIPIEKNNNSNISNASVHSNNIDDNKKQDNLVSTKSSEKTEINNIPSNTDDGKIIQIPDLELSNTETVTSTNHNMQKFPINTSSNNKISKFTTSAPKFVITKITTKGVTTLSSQSKINPSDPSSTPIIKLMSSSKDPILTAASSNHSSQSVSNYPIDSLQKNLSSDCHSMNSNLSNELQVW
jgi:hypothetical protein